MGLGLPKQPGEYRRLTVDGVELHLPYDLDSPYPLVIKLQNFFGFRSLHLEGWKLV